MTKKNDDEPALTQGNEKVLKLIHSVTGILFDVTTTGGALGWMGNAPCGLYSLDSGETFGVVACNFESGEKFWLGKNEQDAQFDARLLDLDGNSFQTWRNDSGGRWRVFWTKHDAPWQSVASREEYIRRVRRLFRMVPLRRAADSCGFKMLNSMELQRVESARAY
ncbi:MAG: hypothetical protein Kow0065_10350 [Methylomicrobium sp.]